MQVENKYYIPEPREFHIGFEYEMFEDFDTLPEKSWHKFVYGENGTDNPENLTYPLGGKMDNIRVKCLDRQDVEELGWEVIQEPYRWQFQYKEWNRWKFTCDIYTSKDPFPIPHPNSGSISIKDNKDGDDYCVFYGYIRNKSEFRRIMEHLDIIQFKPLNLTK